MADGAVLFLMSLRLIPQAAHKRFDMTWSGSFLLLNSLEVCLFFRAFIRGTPPSVCGAGKGMVIWTCADISRVRLNPANTITIKVKMKVLIKLVLNYN